MDRGVCHLSIIPVRADHADESEIVTQLLFGETFTIVGRFNQWVNICTSTDEYVGWVDEKQFIQLDDNQWASLQSMEKGISTNVFQKIESRKRTVNILVGSILYFDRGELSLLDERFQYPILQYISPSKKGVDEILQTAHTFLGSPYLWGGRTHFGIDCSGFTQMVFRLNGYDIPRDASQQVKVGKTIDPNFARAGDVVFFVNKNDKVHHVGIMVSEDQIVHASGEVRVDYVDEKGIFNEDLNKYTHSFHCVQRIAE